MTPPRHPRDSHGRWTRRERSEWEAIAAELDAVEVALLVAEAERAVILAEAVDGSNVPDARRPLTRAEITAGVRFGPIDQRIHRTADRITAATDPLATHITATVHATIAAAPTVDDARRTIAAWASPIAPTVMPGLTVHAARAVDEIRPHLEQAWTAGARDVVAEAAHQGVTAPAGPAMTADTAAMISAAALAVVTQRAGRLLSIANTTLQASPATAPVLAADQVRDALVKVPVAGTTDAARQAVHQAQTSARTATVRDMIREGHVPASFHSTEQLDSNTCLACSHVDGTEYATLDGVLADYREDGGCRWCAGGLRCRGFYVTVWSTETPATVPMPPPQAPAAGPPVTPTPVPVTPTPVPVTPTPPSAPGSPPPVTPPPGRPPVPPGPRPRWIDDPDPADAIRRALHDVFTNAAANSGLTITSSLAPGTRGTVEVHIIGTDRHGARPLRAIRTVDPRARNVEHDLFILEDTYQGKGIATRMLKDSFALYRAQGIERVYVHANINVGGYTWASSGFDWDMRYYRTIDRLRLQVAHLLTAIDNAATTPVERAAVQVLRRQAAASTNYATMPTPAELSSIGREPGLDTWAGHAGLLDSDWFGVKTL